MDTQNPVNNKLIYVIIFLISIIFTILVRPTNITARFVGNFFSSYAVWRIFGGSNLKSLLIALITAIPAEWEAVVNP